MQSSLVPNAGANQMSVEITSVPNRVFMPTWWAHSLISSFKDAAATLMTQCWQFKRMKGKEVQIKNPSPKCIFLKLHRFFTVFFFLPMQTLARLLPVLFGFWLTWCAWPSQCTMVRSCEKSRMHSTYQKKTQNRTRFGFFGACTLLAEKRRKKLWVFLAV